MPHSFEESQVIELPIRSHPWTLLNFEERPTRPHHQYQYKSIEYKIYFVTINSMFNSVSLLYTCEKEKKYIILNCVKKKKKLSISCCLRLREV